MGMLVLSRKADEGITITIPASAVEQTIHVKVLEIKGEKSRIGFDASREICIHRDEIQRAIKQASLPLIRIGDALPGVANG